MIITKNKYNQVNLLIKEATDNDNLSDIDYEKPHHHHHH